MGNGQILKVVQTTEILGKKIAMYMAIETPLFLASDAADWIDYSKNPKGSRQTSNMMKSIYILMSLIPNCWRMSKNKGTTSLWTS